VLNKFILTSFFEKYVQVTVKRLINISVKISPLCCNELLLRKVIQTKDMNRPHNVTEVDRIKIYVIINNSLRFFIYHIKLFQVRECSNLQ
jgi:hypothetical protein